MKQKIFALGRSFVILYLMLYLGSWLAFFIPIGIPDSIWGLLLLFFALTSRLIPLEWVYSGANLLIRYMAILFVPVSVGVMEHWDILLSQAKIFLIPNMISTLLTLIIIGLLAERLFSLNKFARLRKKVLKKRQKAVLL